jgi:hypothetical protein
VYLLQIFLEGLVDVLVFLVAFLVSTYLPHYLPRLVGNQAAISQMTPVASTQGHRLSGFKTLPINASRISSTPAQRLRLGVNPTWSALYLFCKCITPAPTGSAVEPITHFSKVCLRHVLDMRGCPWSERHVSFYTSARPIGI